MNKQTPYLTQYCDMITEFENNGFSIKNVSDEQRIQLKVLQELFRKAIEQSGLTAPEANLISICRHYDISRKVSLYAHKLIDKI